jgi:glycosyltransferase 2 family protein
LRKGIIQTLKFLSFFAVGVFLLWLAFRNIDFKSLTSGLKEAKYIWLLLAMLFAIIAYISRARRWILLIKPLGFNPSFVNTFNAVMTGYLANLALPRIGEITRCVALGKKENIPVDQLFGTVVIERTIDFFSLLTIMIIMIFLSGDAIGLFLKESILIPIQQEITSLFGSAWILWLILPVLFIILFFLMIRFRKNLRKIRFFAKMFDLAKGIIDGLKTITNLNRKWEFLFHTIFIWINYALMTWVVVFAVESTSHLSLSDGIFLLVIGGLAMSAPVQSGLGIFHYTISRGLFIVYGIPLEDGLVYAILSHESQLLFIAIVGTISFFSIFGKHRKRKIS